MVLDSSFEISNVAVIPTRMAPVSPTAEMTDPSNPDRPATKNIVITEMRAGKRPLQGTKLFVRMAMSRSLGESIIRHPTTPAALQPNPIHMDEERKCCRQMGFILFGLISPTAICSALSASFDVGIQK